MHLSGLKLPVEQVLRQAGLLDLRPGLAMSQDGRNWARIEADHHSGALFDVGQPGEWDELFIGGPQVGRAGWLSCWSRCPSPYVALAQGEASV